MRKISGNTLLDTAIAWYRKNGNVPIPEYSKVGDSDVFGSLYYQEEKYTIETWSIDGEDNSISEASGSVIPLLAAISLGFDSHALSQIIDNHSIDLSEVTGLNFGESTSTGIPRADGDVKTLTPVRIHIEAMKAFSTKLEHFSSLDLSMRDKPLARQSLGAMHTNEEALWPTNLIKDHVAKIMTPNANPVWSLHKRFGFTVSAPQSKDELPNGNPIDLLRRNGMLSEPVLRKQTGFFDHWEDLVFTAGNDHPLQVDILRSLGKVQHRPTLDLIIRGIRSINCDSTEDFLDAPTVHFAMVDAFGGNEAFEEVLKSRILLLNLIHEEDFAERKHLDSMAKDKEMFSPLLNDQHLILSDLAKELLARPPHQLGHSDYSAIKKLDIMALPKQEITFSPEKLLNHVLDSLNTFVSPNRLDCQHKKDIDEMAIACIQPLARLLVKHHDFDYDQLNQRPEKTKLELIRGGFDVKKFTGLSNRSKGIVLEDQLGL